MICANSKRKPISVNLDCIDKFDLILCEPREGTYSEASILKDSLFKKSFSER